MKDQEVKKKSIELQPSEQPREQHSTDVLIVGGGIAAITASLTFLSQASAASFAISVSFMLASNRLDLASSLADIASP